MSGSAGLQASLRMALEVDSAKTPVQLPRAAEPTPPGDWTTSRYEALHWRIRKLNDLPISRINTYL